MIEITRDTELTQELLKELKAQYKKLYKTSLSDGTEIIWHRLTRSQYKDLMKKYEDVENRSDKLWSREEEAVRLAVVYPCQEVIEELINDSAGVATVLSDSIYEKSGFELVDSETSEV